MIGIDRRLPLIEFKESPQAITDFSSSNSQGKKQTPT